MTSVMRHVRANAIAYVALFVALGGTSYAAMSLPAGSVGARQIKNHVITPVKLDPKVHQRVGAILGDRRRQWARDRVASETEDVWLRQR